MIGTDDRYRRGNDRRRGTDEAVLIEGIFYGGRDVEGAFDDKR